MYEYFKHSPLYQAIYNTNTCMIHTNDRKTHPVLLIFLWKLYITDDILFVLIVLTTRHFRCGSLSFTNTSPYPFKDFDVICCLFSDETGGLLDQQEPLLGHSLSWEINKPPNQTGTNRYSAKVWVPEIPTESDLINLSSYSNDFHQYLWWFFSKTKSRGSSEKKYILTCCRRYCAPYLQS